MDKSINLVDFLDKNVHFVGIGGVSLSRLAMFLKNIGAHVSGSDSTYSANVAWLTSHGINVTIGTDTAKITHIHYIVRSAAVTDNNSEIAYGRAHNVPIVERSELLDIIARHFRYSIALSGTHGKSSVTALICHIFNRAGAAFFGHFGAESVEDENNYTGDEYFITEACEYKRSFLALAPTIGVVLDIDYDHPDEYSSLEDTKSAFATFMDNSRVVICHESVDYDGAITYGVGDRATYKIDNVVLSGGHYTFDIVHNGNRVHLTSPLVGSHNVQNVAAAYVVADSVGIDNAVIASAIAHYKGLRRRYEVKGETTCGASVVSDYAHHPSEIEKVIESAHTITRGKVCVVFEPHTYSRTKSLIAEFSDCFYWADSLILLPTYAAREVPSDGYDTIDLMTHLRRVGEYPLYFGDYSSAKNYIDATFTAGDTILVLGAGTIDHLADMLSGRV